MPIHLVLLAALIPVWLIWYGMSFGRVKAFQRVVRELNFEYEGESNPLYADKGIFVKPQLFNRDEGDEFRNVSRGFANGKAAVLFDYVIFKGSGHYQVPVSQTVIAYRLTRSTFPDFQLARNSLVQWTNTSYTEPAITSDPDFAKDYQISGWDHGEIFRRFDASTTSFFRSIKDSKWNVEKAGEWLLIYRSGKKVSAARLREFVESTQTVASFIDN